MLSSPDDQVCWFITNFNRLYKTSDGGQAWTVVPPGNPNFVPSGLVVVNADVGFKTGLGAAYKTTNGGSSWSTSGVTQPPAPIAESAGNGQLWVRESRMWVVMTNGDIAFAADSAATWIVPSGEGITFGNAPHVSFANELFGLAIYGNWPFVYVTTDGAQSWTQVDNSLGANEEVLAVGSECWYIPNPADHFYIKYSSDAGAHWVEQQSESAGYNVLSQSRAGRTLWAGTITGRDFTHLLPSTAAVGPSSEPALALDAYPNPTDGPIRLRWSARDEISEYRLFDAMGASVVRGRVHGSELSLSNLPRGCYWLRATDGTGTRSASARVVVR